MTKKMSSFLVYSRQFSLWAAWVVVMILLYLGYGIHWVGARLMPALARTQDTIEVSLNATNQPAPTTTSESEG